MEEQKEQKQLTLKEQNELRKKRQDYLKFLKDENELMEAQLKYYQYSAMLPEWHAKFQEVQAQQALQMAPSPTVLEGEICQEEAPIVEFKGETKEAES
jgi:hypothetical protein